MTLFQNPVRIVIHEFEIIFTSCSSRKLNQQVAYQNRAQQKFLHWGERCVTRNLVFFHFSFQVVEFFGTTPRRTLLFAHHYHHHPKKQFPIPFPPRSFLSPLLYSWSIIADPLHTQSHSFQARL